MLLCFFLGARSDSIYACRTVAVRHFAEPMMQTNSPEPNSLAFILGPLERRILEEVWSRKSLTVRELLVDGKVQLAYTTLMTTLDRLFKKGLLERTEEGRAFRYSARCAPADVPRFIAVATMRRWIKSIGPSPLPLSCFVEAVSDQDITLLDELWGLVEMKRAELKKNKEKAS